MKNKTLLYTIIFAVIFSVVFGITYSFFKKIIAEQPKGFAIISLSAFMGAFFAFFFARIGDYFTKIQGRRLRGYNELIYLDILFNRCIQISSDNQGLLELFIQTLEKRGLFAGELNHFPLREEAPANLTNVPFSNKIFSVMLSLDRANNDISRINQWNTELRSARLKGDMSSEAYEGYIIYLVRDLKELNKSFIALRDNEILRLTAENRVLRRKEETILNKILGILFRAHKTKVSKDEIDKEIEELLKEIQKVREKSKKEIENTLSKE
ncbi:MAG TPA: hypothetical protein VJ165_04340 [candidate division Zixibacteria bacterium]|nr:hypothetical protein [candidate division Zixibacteria bacterium]